PSKMSSNLASGARMDLPTFAQGNGDRLLGSSSALSPTVDFFSEVRQHLFAGKGPHLAALSPLKNADRITRPVLLIQDLSRQDIPQGQGAYLKSALKRRGIVAESLD